MKIQEFKDYKEKFDIDMMNYIQSEIDRFKKDTGINLTGICITTEFLHSKHDSKNISSLVVFKVNNKTEL